MNIVTQSAPFLSTLLPAVPLLAAPPKRLALPSPRIAGYLSAKAGGYMDSPLQVTLFAPAEREKSVKPAKRLVTAQIIEQPRIDINIYEDPKGWWEEFERIFGRIKSIEEMDAELEAKHPGYLAWVARRQAFKAQAVQS